LIKDKNYAFKSVTVTPGEAFENCNFIQAKSETDLFSGTEGLEFYRCNLTNVKLPPDAKKVGCLHIQKDLCYWIHGGAGLPEEPENCRHVTQTDEMIIDGVVAAYEYEREDTLL